MGKSFLKNQWIHQIKFHVCIVILALLSIFFKPAFALTLGNETDRLALLALKGQLGVLNSCNDSVHFCDWEGVRCGRRHQRVRILNLGRLKLDGSISPFIGNLSFLRKANLSDNKLKGNIPVELTNCSNLQVLILSYNNLTGNIPFNIGGMKNLIQFSVGFNSLSGTIPSSFGNLSSLNYLVLAFNYLEGNIPSALGRVSNMEILDLGDNKLFSTIPPAVYNLSSITLLSLGTNKLSDQLAPKLGFSFPKLEAFYIGGNQFTGRIPRSVSNISSLQHFDIPGNSFFGSVPNNLGNLKNLQILVMDYNQLRSGKAGDLDFISSLTNCSQLHELVINVNRFGGVLPGSISNLSTQLQLLYMGRNQIYGSVPEGIDNLFNLNIST